MKKGLILLVKVLAAGIVAVAIISSVIAIFGRSDYLSSNRRLFRDGNHTFTHAYINLGGTWQNLRIKSWCDFPNGDEVQIWTEDGRCMLTHYANVVLVNDKPEH